MIQQKKNIKIKQRKRWLLIPLLVMVILLALIPFFRNPRPKEDPADEAWHKIRERGYMIALTDKNSLDYFVLRGEPMGYQLSLLKSFADEMGVPLKIVASNDISRLFYYLDMHAGDVIACNLPVTGEGKKKVHFSEPLGESRLVLVQRKLPGGSHREDSRRVRSAGDFTNDTIYVRRNLFEKPLLDKLYRKAGGNLTVIEVTDKSTEQLIGLVSQGKIRFTLCDETLARVMKRVYPNLDADWVISGAHDVGWCVGQVSDTLLLKLNEWVTRIRKNKELKRTYQAYYDNPGVPGYFRNDYFSIKGVRISPFDEDIRRLSKTIPWDWRLLASLIYEESNFQLGVVSSRNATGLMQLMPETALKFGMDSLSSPAQQLEAGVGFVRWLDEQFASEITDPKERIFFILASYNVGPGKVLAAREKAKKYGKDPNRWKDHVDYYLTRRSLKDPDPPPDPEFDLYLSEGSGRFVDNILNRYYHYKNNIPD